jgi:hypothetical protein
VGDSNFDIGHLFGASGGGGNAGCIGCVCSNDISLDTNGDPIAYKGSGFTSPADGIPMGDNFDIDYVVCHEMGHQLGANHTFSFDIEGTELIWNQVLVQLLWDMQVLQEQQICKVIQTLIFMWQALNKFN